VYARTQTDKLQKQKEQIDDAQSGIAEANAESRELESRQLVRHSVSLEAAEDMLTHWPFSLSVLQFIAKQLQAAAEKLVRLEKVQREKQEAAQQALQEVTSLLQSVPACARARVRACVVYEFSHQI
jgi:hypothetical protein